MMYLTEPKMSDIVMKQYKFKLNSYVGALTSLIMTQILAIFMSFSGSGMMGTSSEFVGISVHYYTADFLNAFMMLWAFITAITITTKAYRYDDFSFVTNRTTSNLSNMLFLLTLSIVGAITTFLGGFLLKTLLYFWFDMEKMTIMQTTLLEYVTGLIALIFYLLLFSAIGYFLGTLYQVSKVSLFLSIVLIIAAIFLLGIQIQGVFQFFASESSIGIFIIKVLFTVIILFATSTVISNKMEVR